MHILSLGMGDQGLVLYEHGSKFLKTPKSKVQNLRIDTAIETSGPQNLKLCVERHNKYIIKVYLRLGKSILQKSKNHRPTFGQYQFR